MSELNAQLMMEDQFSLNEALVNETARLKRELAEAEAQCVICRDAKPSKAFVPCGHVCVCSSCWDGFVQTACLPQRGGVFLFCFYLSGSYWEVAPAHRRQKYLNPSASLFLKVPKHRARPWHSLFSCQPVLPMRF